tara:strand:+ start:644 stop:1033 length:390 start_codon:yes stop_codon:yes gene_type:complete
MKGEPFVPATKIEPDGMTPFGWEKNPRHSWKNLLDGRRFDVKNKPISRRTFYNKKKSKKEDKAASKATKQEVQKLILSIEEKKRRNNLTWARVEKITGVASETIRNWKNDSSSPTLRKIESIFLLLEQN